MEYCSCWFLLRYWLDDNELRLSQDFLCLLILFELTRNLMMVSYRSNSSHSDFYIR